MSERKLKALHQIVLSPKKKPIEPGKIFKSDDHEYLVERGAAAYVDDEPAAGSVDPTVSTDPTDPTDPTASTDPANTGQQGLLGQ